MAFMLLFLFLWSTLKDHKNWALQVLTKWTRHRRYKNVINVISSLWLHYYKIWIWHDQSQEYCENKFVSALLCVRAISIFFTLSIWLRLNFERLSSFSQSFLHLFVCTHIKKSSWTFHAHFLHQAKNEVFFALFQCNLIGTNFICTCMILYYYSILKYLI